MLVEVLRGKVLLIAFGGYIFLVLNIRGRLVLVVVMMN
jgi:hypothetical protein